MTAEFMTPEEQEEIVRYGLERMKSRAIAIGATLMLGGTLGMLAESIVFFLCFIGVRRYAGGYHADTQVRCYVISFGITVGAFVFIKYVSISDSAFWILLLGSLVVLLLFSPVDCENRRLELWEKERYGRRARIAAVCVFLISVCLWKADMLYLAKAAGVAEIVAGGCVIAGELKNGRWYR